MAHHHYLDHSVVHYAWNNQLQPRLRIAAGDTITFDCRDAADGHYTSASTQADLNRPRTFRGHPLTGPVFIEDAQPGDTLVVEVLKLEDKGWAWTACGPRGGLLPGEFEPYLKIWQVRDGYAEFKPGIRVPLEPFCGVMGVAPTEPGDHSTSPPRSAGGNMDIRHLVAGSTLYLPVLVPGALFSCGDCHLAQGDGEVCLTGLEAPMTVTLRFGLQKGRRIPGPQFRTPSPLTRTDTKGYYATTGIQPDLMEAAKEAIRHMVDHLVAEYGLTREEAYVLCSAAVDLKISEVVDAPNCIVSAFLPLSIFA